MPRAIRQANTVITIFGLTSTKSSGSAYTRAPIFLAVEMAYLPKAQRLAQAVISSGGSRDWWKLSTNLALLSFSSSVKSSVLSRSYLIDPGWMESIRSRTGILLLIDRSYRESRCITITHMHSGWLRKGAGLTVGGAAVGDLEAGDGVFSALPESLVDPGHDGFIRHLLSITELLQDVESVPEEAGASDMTSMTFTIREGLLLMAPSLPSHELPQKSQSERSIPSIQVLPSNPHQGELGLRLPQFNGVVTVLQLQSKCCRTYSVFSGVSPQNPDVDGWRAADKMVSIELTQYSDT